MARRQEARSEQTQAAILKAAARLFSRRAFDDVTMREIAKAAGEALLNQLATGPLVSLREKLERIARDEATPPDDRLKSLSREFIHFTLSNRAMYATLFTTKLTRVDDKDPKLAVQRLRNELFDQLKLVVYYHEEDQVRRRPSVAWGRSAHVQARTTVQTDGHLYRRYGGSAAKQ